MHVHRSYALFHNARHRAAPPGMKGPHRLVHRVGNQDGQAIRGLNAQHQSGTVGHHAIAGQRLSTSPLHKMNIRRVDLPQRHQ